MITAFDVSEYVLPSAFRTFTPVTLPSTAESRSKTLFDVRISMFLLDVASLSTFIRCGPMAVPP